jgi:FtsH ternary system domain X7
VPGKVSTPSPPVLRVAEETPVRTVVGEFRTASAALVFAGGLADLTDTEFGHCAATGAWWATTRLTLATARELITAAGGRVHVQVDGGLVPDRGWGDQAPVSANQGDPPEIVEVDVMEAVRTAGLHHLVLPVGEHVTVLAPARRLSALAQRALDLDLTITHRLVRLDPLFTPEGQGVAEAAEMLVEPPTMFEVRLTSPSGPLPVALISALDRDACVLLCRRATDRLLIQHDVASALPDRQLAVLAGRDTRAGAWLLADIGFGSARLTPLTDIRDGTTLVRLSDQHRLRNLDPEWAALTGPAVAPEPTPLRLVRTRTPDAVIDAVLLDDSDLRCLPALLEGRQLADLATLATGRDRHLMLAPGGVLEHLPVGEPLYRLGPGPLYLPLGHRTQPLLPPTARQALFATTPDTALVLLPTTIQSFPLAHRAPVWTLWAGPLPPVDHQLPPEARQALAEADQQTTPASNPNRPAPRPPIPKLADRPRRPTPDHVRSWQDDALEAELAEDLVRAAELCERHGEPRRAAYLYERAAHQPPRTPDPTR